FHFVDARTGRKVHPSLAPKDGRRPTLSPDGRTCALWHDGGSSLRFWDVATGKEHAWLSEKGRCFAFSPDGKHVAIVDSSVIQVWDLAAARKECQFEGHDANISAIAFSPDGRILATGDCENNVCLWELATAKRICPIYGHRGWVDSVAFSP